MKSLNDSLREEFDEILNKVEYKKIIDNEGLDKAVLKKAFDTLLKYKSDSEAIDKSKTEFENYLINYFKIQKNDN
jgi:5'-deoxynucleotidase YfbR-like HD superfamily hydrolase